LHDALAILFVKNQLSASFIECREVADAAAMTTTTTARMIVIITKGNTGDGLAPGEDVRNGEKNINANVLNPKKQCELIVKNRMNGWKGRDDMKSRAKSKAKSSAKSAAKNGSL
jgi:hypothetical protein